MNLVYKIFCHLSFNFRTRDSVDSRLTFFPERNFNTAAAMEIEDSKPCVEEIPEDVNDILGDDEAAEILEAMLGLAPAALATEAPKKKRRNSMKVRVQLLFFNSYRKC